MRLATTDFAGIFQGLPVIGDLVPVDGNPMRLSPESGREFTDECLIEPAFQNRGVLGETMTQCIPHRLIAMSVMVIVTGSRERSTP